MRIRFEIATRRKFFDGLLTVSAPFAGFKTMAKKNWKRCRIIAVAAIKLNTIHSGIISSNLIMKLVQKTP